ncbi:MAG TPA: hypothetical protein VJO16_14260 [Candidatus Acidoferrum sp.]|nr:hypothetical protein [Candidatus Acidoferrum sp.]
MWKALSFFFVEAWSHRQNKFIAVGSTAVVLLFLMMALAPVPGVPELLKRSIAVLLGISILATIVLMFYYVLKFALTGVVLLFKRISGLPKREDRAELGQRNPAK